MHPWPATVNAPRNGGHAARSRYRRRDASVTSTRPRTHQHATPDVELAEAQMALGRPDLATDSEPEFDEAEVEAAEVEAAEADAAQLDAAPDEEEYYAEDDGDEASAPAR